MYHLARANKKSHIHLGIYPNLLPSAKEAVQEQQILLISKDFVRIIIIGLKNRRLLARP